MIIIAKSVKLFLSVTAIIFSSIVLLAVKTLFVGAFIGGVFTYQPSFEKAEKSYEDNQDRLTEIAEYLDSSGYGDIIINNLFAANKMSVDYEDIAIENANIVKDIRMLKLHGYDSISGNDNSIEFEI